LDEFGKTLQEKSKKINLAEIDEGSREVQPDKEGTRRLLPAFEVANVKIHLLTDSLDKLYSKSKYKDLFDIGVMSIHSANKIDPELMVLFKDKAKLHVETADYIVIMKKEQRQEFRSKIQEKCEKANLKLIKEPPYKHHMMFEVSKVPDD